MAKLSLELLKGYVANVVTAAKVSNGTFNVTRDNVIALVDKIGKIVTLDTAYAIDKLSMFDGEYLSFGKTIEEWQADLIMVQDYDPDGAGALAPHVSTFRPNFYSYTLGKKVIKQTLRNNDIERAVHFVEQFNEIVSMMVKRLSDSMAAYRYDVKRQMLGRFINLCLACYDSSVTTFVASTAYSVGTLLKSGAGKFGIVVTAIAAADAYANWAAAVASGKLIEYSLVSEIAKPVDATTGEAFVEEAKKIVEVAQDLSEGNSLNGNTLGAVEGLVLIVKQGILPNLDVKTLAGAFHEDKLILPETIVLRDFGSADDDVYAVIMDRRAMRLHNTYRATRENINGDGDFTNLFEHTEDTAWISRNAFIHVFKIPA